jgi:hypothetical protein
MMGAFRDEIQHLQVLQADRHLHAVYTIEHIRKLFKAVFGVEMPSDFEDKS